VVSNLESGISEQLPDYVRSISFITWRVSCIDSYESCRQGNFVKSIHHPSLFMADRQINNTTLFL
jgi:hypothetical protein